MLGDGSASEWDGRTFHIFTIKNSFNLSSWNHSLMRLTDFSPHLLKTVTLLKKIQFNAAKRTLYLLLAKNTFCYAYNALCNEIEL